MAHIGIDIGGTHIKGIRFDGTTIQHSVTSPTPADDPEALIDEVVAQILDLQDSDTTPVGVAVAAFLDAARKTVTFSPNIAWSNVPLAEILERRVGTRIVLENDANAACYGEYVLGAGQGTSQLAMLTLGTGVGGAIMVDGRLVTGGTGVAGELGHLPLGSGAKTCGCGAAGCVETVASGTAIVARVRQLVGKPDATADEVTEVLEGDAAVRSDVLREVGEVLAKTIITLHRVTNPQRVVIGGGVMERSGGHIIEAINDAAGHLLTSRADTKWPELVPATLGNRAGGFGAGLLAVG